MALADLRGAPAATRFWRPFWLFVDHAGFVTRGLFLEVFRDRPRSHCLGFIDGRSRLWRRRQLGRTCQPAGNQIIAIGAQAHFTDPIGGAGEWDAWNDEPSRHDQNAASSAGALSGQPSTAVIAYFEAVPVEVAV